jgi:hypothetical protein
MWIEDTRQMHTLEQLNQFVCDKKKEMKSFVVRNKANLLGHQWTWRSTRCQWKKLLIDVMLHRRGRLWKVKHIECQPNIEGHAALWLSRRTKLKTKNTLRITLRSHFVPAMTILQFGSYLTNSVTQNFTLVHVPG